MMIEPLHANITLVAMRSSWGSIDETCITELHFEVVGLDWKFEHPGNIPHLAVLVFLVKGDFAGFFVLVPRENFGDHSWICEAQEEKKDLY